MLILSRKRGQSIVIGNSVRVTVLDCSPGLVRLGFVGPPDVSIHREEIFCEIASANRGAVDLECDPPASGEPGLASLDDELGE